MSRHDDAFTMSRDGPENWAGFLKTALRLALSYPQTTLYPPPKIQFLFNF